MLLLAFGLDHLTLLGWAKMLSVAVHKDIGEYEPKIVGKLTVRSLVCTALALISALAIGAYSWFILGISTDYSMYAIFTVALPIWMAGFWRPKGMKAEKFIPLWLIHNFSNNRLHLISTPYKAFSTTKKERTRISKDYRRIIRLRAIEAYEPEKHTYLGKEDI